MTTIIKTSIIIAICFLLGVEANAQRDYDLYWVGFKNKNGTPYSIFKPQEYLSPRALERRSRFGIPIDSLDLPINPEYLEPIKVKGFKVHYTSKWLNGVVIIRSDDVSVSPEDLLVFDFIKEVYPIGFKRKVMPIPPKVGKRDYEKEHKTKDSYYGYGENQIHMLNGHYLHKMGYQGQGMHVAVFDGGFDGLPETPAFDSLMNNSRILGTRDFVQGDEYVYESSTHGRDVLSTMASDMPFLFVGTAPKASYYLFKTEDDPLGEYVAEEYHWVAAAEYADELGVDVINTSLGYYDFDDDAMDYAYDDLDGKTAVISKGAKIAGKKGILVVSSAGNEGNNKWKKITVPNDANNILTVGAVNRDGYSARFSSMGFGQKDVLKPNVVARGVISVVAAKRRYDTRYNNGTSFASPIMAGMVTCFWQAFPTLSNMDIIYTLQNNSSQFEEPDTVLGYGIPDFLAAHYQHRNSVIELKKDHLYYKHIEDLGHRFDLFMKEVDAVDIQYKLFNSYGKLIHQGSEALITPHQKQLWHLDIPMWNQLPDAVYYLEVGIGARTHRILLTK